MNKHKYNNIDQDITIDFNPSNRFDVNEADDMKDNISIEDLLNNRYNITLNSKKQALCPFHDENTPSFKVYDDRAFKCFGCGEHGTIFDLVMKLEHKTFIEAKDVLRSFYSSPSNYSLNNNIKINKKIKKKTVNKSSNATRTIITIQPIQSKDVINYVHSRGISNLSNLQEVIYRDHNNILRRGLTWSNESEGIEISYYKFKSANGKKDITYIKAPVKADTLLIFEGYFDYLSYREMNFKKSKQVDICILNSVTLISKLFDRLPKRIKHIGLALDNDNAGDKATLKIQDHYRTTKINVMDHRQTYKKYNDLNDRLLKKKMSKEDYKKRKEA
jgi:DNA primase